MPKVMIFIQARLTSKRLPGKVLMDIKESSPILEKIYYCCLRALGTPVFLIPDNELNRPLEDYLKKTCIEYFKGSEDDVLARFHLAALHYKPKTIVRITGDCPFTSPDLIDLALKFHKAMGKEFTHFTPIVSGLNVEVFETEALIKAAKNTLDPYDREHVTPWMKRNCSVCEISKLSLDTQEDLDLFREVLRD